MNSYILHHKIACQNFICEWSIHFCSLSVIFTPLHSRMNQELFKKDVCNQSSHYEKYDGTVHPSYCLKLKYPLPFSVSYVWLVIHSNTNQEVFEKHLCNKSSHCEESWRFLIMEGKYTCNHQINAFWLSAKMNQAGDTSKSQKNALHVLPYAKRHLSDGSNAKQWNN